MIVDNRVAVVVAIDRSIHEGLEPEEQEDVVNRLAMELTGAGFPTSPDDIRARLEDDRFNRYAPVPIAVDVPEELKIYFEEHTAEYPSVVVERKAVRSYPYGSLAAHIVGYVGKINEAELEAVADEREKPYGLNDEIGKSGVEQTFERYLRGTPGIRRIEVDSQGDPVRVISETPPVPGDDLVLTIDLDVQALAEQKLRQGLEAARARPNRDGTVNNATTGSTVVIDPNNGQIIAMASYPSYDPSTFVDGIDAAEWAALNDGEPLPAEQLGDPGPVSARVDLQAVRRPRRSWPGDGGRHRVLRPGRLPDPRVLRRQVLPAQRRRGRVRQHHPAPGDHDLVGRVLLPRGCPVLAPARPVRRRRGDAEPPGDLGTGRPHRRRADQRGPGPGPDPGLEARLLRPGELQRRRLAHRRQRQHGDRPGRRAGDALQLANGYAFANGGTRYVPDRFGPRRTRRAR